MKLLRVAALAFVLVLGTVALAYIVLAAALQAGFLR